MKYVGCSDAQVSWGSNDDPRECGLVVGNFYEIVREEAHSWHTKYYLKEFPGKKFNSACFECPPCYGDIKERSIMKKVEFKELLQLFAESSRQQISKATVSLGATHVVVFENQQMDSSHFRERSALMVGPGCTYQTIEEVEGHHLGDVPSRFQYPTVYSEVKK